MNIPIYLSCYFKHGTQEMLNLRSRAVLLHP